MSHEAKLNGIVRDVLDRTESGGAAVLLVAHFPDLAAELSTRVEQLDSAVPTSVVLAGDLERNFGERLRLDESIMLDLIVAERHPLPAEDDALAVFLDQLPCKCRVGHHLSLDDPLISRFVGPSVRLLVESIGLKESESIDSSIVSRRIRATQIKIEQESHSNEPAGNASDWFDINMP